MSAQLPLLSYGTENVKWLLRMNILGNIPFYNFLNVFKLAHDIQNPRHDGNFKGILLAFPLKHILLFTKKCNVHVTDLKNCNFSH